MFKTFANRLTLLRILIIPFLVLFLMIDHIIARIIALLLFILASITDTIDGYLARKYNQISDSGKFLDPLADKLLVCSVFVCFVGIPEISIPAWLVVIIVSREIGITGFRSIVLTRGKIIPADTLGKTKTTVQMVAILLIFIVLIIKTGWHASSVGLTMFPIWVTVSIAGLTFYSGISYLWKFRQEFK